MTDRTTAWGGGVDKVLWDQCRQLYLKIMEYKDEQLDSYDYGDIDKLYAFARQVASRENERALFMDADERYEEKARLFNRETGMMAPGKSEPLAGNHHDLRERQQRWDEWFEAKAAAIRARHQTEGM